MMVREWSRLPNLDGDSIEGSVSSFNRNYRTRQPRAESRQNFVHTPFSFHDALCEFYLSRSWNARRRSVEKIC